MREIKKVGIIGAGVIGCAWAARLVLNGFEVHIFDPSERARSYFDRVLENALRAYRNMTLAPVRASGAVRFMDSVAAAVEQVDFVQESSPERIDIKRAILQQIGAAAAADVVIASSSSGLLPTELQRGMPHPERILVGHPFNPVYLIPLVEIVGGRQTAAAARTAAADFYRRIGMHPLQVGREIDAFLADRMMEAMWREALHLVNDGVATVDEIDQAICYGPGLRWAFMGPFLVYRVAGGEGGMRHFMAQFGPSLKWPWTRFDGPELTEQLLDKIVHQSDQQAAGRSIAELEHLRDDCLVAAMQGLRSQDYAAGAVLKRYEETLYQAAHTRLMSAQDELGQPLQLHSDTVRPEWVDYNQHMSESRYLQVFGDASDALLRYIGVDADYHADGLSYYTVETHICHLREVAVGQPLAVETQILAQDDKRIHLFHSLRHAGQRTLLATAEQMLLHVDTRQGRACAARADVLARIARIAEAHSGLENPPAAGRVVGQRDR